MQESKSNFCKTNLNSPNREIIVLGDSMSRTIITSLSENFSSNPISFITGDSCIFLVEVVNERCVRSDTEYNNLLTEFEGKSLYIVDLWQK